MQRKNSVIIPPEQAGGRLLDFVSRRFTYRSGEEWQEEIEAGRFLLNDKEAAADHLLRAGDRLVYRMAPLEEPPVNRCYQVLHEDEELLVIDKPAPLPCHPGGRFFNHTLWALLKEGRGVAKPVFINRLDRETSGIVLLAKTSQAAKCCREQFANQLVEKHYLVLVEGEFPAGTMQADGWLAPDPTSTIRKKVGFFPAGGQVPPGAKSAGTSFRLLATNNVMSLLAAQLHTGRCHQIRATLCSLGYPVAGDKLYGVDEQLFLRFQEDSLTPADHGRLRLKRQALHASCLRILHPTTGRELSFTAPLPVEFQEVMPEIARQLEIPTEQRNDERKANRRSESQEI
jgi:RluA family pseudouridine synthase